MPIGRPAYVPGDMLVLLAVLLLFEGQQHTSQAAVGLGQGLGLCQAALAPFPALLIGGRCQLNKVQPCSLWYALSPSTQHLPWSYEQQHQCQC